ncbi:hypothetical protein F5B20DRAFT_596094 [Whalleya microplaca]|nr:hypothetical protein F5B20DRAFT_596094 [Whalleya microplaca]
MDSTMDASTLAQMHDEDIALAMQLLRMDVQEAVANATRKGKQKEGVVTDAEVAFNLFEQELQHAEAYSNDRRMARSILEAVQTDDDEILRAIHNDSSDEGEPVVPEVRSGAAADEGDYIERLSRIYNTGTDTTGDETKARDQSESSTRPASRQPGKTRPCDACGDQINLDKLATAPCQHEYCSECLTRLFYDATRDETLFPPRCCRQPIPLDDNLAYIDTDVVEEFFEKSVEFSTSNRIYCHNADCASFIPPANCINQVATCNSCASRTCTTCKNAAHGGDCPDDEQLQQVLQLAREEGWQRCGRCRSMVELNVGCYHMTCRCGFQFCYVCGARWKTCACQQWEEEHLYNRAVEIDRRDQEDDDWHNMFPLANPQRQRRIRGIMQNLELDHECNHNQWIRRAGPHQCEVCHDQLPYYTHECQQCHIIVCRRCRYNRL